MNIVHKLLLEKAQRELQNAIKGLKRLNVAHKLLLEKAQRELQNAFKGIKRFKKLVHDILSDWRKIKEFVLVPTHAKGSHFFLLVF